MDFFDFQVVHRVFPLARGVFEDKVSNFWCVLNIVMKIKETYKVEVCNICLDSWFSIFFKLKPENV